MATDELARKEAGLVVVGLTPDVCKSPSVPVPYQIVAYLSDDKAYSPDVNFAKQPAMRLDSKVWQVVGDEAGVGGGVVSGVNKNVCDPLTPCPGVIINHMPAVVKGALFSMNKGNTVGRLQYPPAGAPVTPSSLTACNPIVASESPLESAFMTSGLGQSLSGDVVAQAAQMLPSLATMDWSNPGSLLSAVGGVGGLAGLGDVAALADLGLKGYQIANTDWSNPASILGSVGGFAGLAGLDQVASTAALAAQGYQLATTDWSNPGAILGAASTLGGLGLQGYQLATGSGAPAVDLGGWAGLGPGDVQTAGTIIGALMDGGQIAAGADGSLVPTTKMIDPKFLSFAEGLWQPSSAAGGGAPSRSFSDIGESLLSSASVAPETDAELAAGVTQSVFAKPVVAPGRAVPGAGDQVDEIVTEPAEPWTYIELDDQGKVGIQIDTDAGPVLYEQKMGEPVPTGLPGNVSDATRESIDLAFGTRAEATAVAASDTGAPSDGSNEIGSPAQAGEGDQSDVDFYMDVAQKIGEKAGEMAIDTVVGTFELAWAVGEEVGKAIAGGDEYFEEKEKAVSKELDEWNTKLSKLPEQREIILQERGAQLEQLFTAPSEFFEQVGTDVGVFWEQTKGVSGEIWQDYKDRNETGGEAVGELIGDGLGGLYDAVNILRPKRGKKDADPSNTTTQSQIDHGAKENPSSANRGANDPGGAKATSSSAEASAGSKKGPANDAPEGPAAGQPDGGPGGPGGAVGRGAGGGTTNADVGSAGQKSGKKAKRDGKKDGKSANGDASGSETSAGDSAGSGSGDAKTAGSGTPHDNSRVDQTGEPVDVVTGRAFVDEEDFTLPGPIPLRLARGWHSTSRYEGPIGNGWHHSYDLFLREEPDGFSMRLADGRIARFGRLGEDGVSFNRKEQLWLEPKGDDGYVVRGIDNLLHCFSPGSNDELVLESIRDLSGNTIRFEHDGLGLAVIIDSAGRRIELRRDSQGRIEAVMAPHPDRPDDSTPLMRYEYSAEGDLVTATDPAAGTLRYVYENRLMTVATDQNGLSFYHEYEEIDGERVCTKTWGDRDFLHRELEFDKANQRTTVTDWRGEQRVFHWNDAGLVVREVDPYGQSKCREYDEDDRRISETDELGQRTRYGYDHLGRMWLTEDAAGGRAVIAYDHLHNPVLVTQADGSAWQYEYDEDGRLLSVMNPAGARTSYAYDEAGRVAAITDALNAIREFRWNTRHELTEEQLPNGAVIRYAYDELGRLSSIDEPEDGHTSYEYDPVGRLVATKDAQGGVTRLEYNARGQITAVTDPLGQRTDYEYDGTPFIHLRRNADGTEFRYEYDGEFNLVALINENGDRYRLSYDANDRLVAEVGFDGRRQAYRYDRAGRLKTYRDGDKHTTLERDPLGRLLRKHTPDGELHEFAYDPLGRLLEANNPTIDVAFGYDKVGNLVEERQGERPLTHEYDEVGNRVATTLPSGQRIEQEFDSVGAFTRVAFDGELVASVERDLASRERVRRTGATEATFDYDPLGRLTTQKVANDQRTIVRRQYGYDVASNLKSIDDLTRGRTEYELDPRGRINSVLGGTAEQFLFDPAGNFLDEQRPKGGFVKGNRLLVYQDRKFEYDDSGNLVREAFGAGHRQVIEYAYNGSNQLVEVRRNKQRTSYEYDALSRRVSKVDAFGQTDFLWNCDRLVHERRRGLERVFVYEPGTFRPLAQVHNGTTCNYQLDHLGTPRELVDRRGRMVWQATHRAYGSVVSEETRTVDTPLRFLGQYSDEESGLHYNRHRYYHPVTGRYLSQDRIGLVGGDNPYQYALAPTIWVDPLGLSSELGGGNQPTPNEAPDFDTARRQAFEHAGMTDPQEVVFSKVDPKTGTVVEFKGRGGAKVGYDAPHVTPGPHHDVQHISAQEAGKRSAGGRERENFPYSGPRHPSRPGRK